ncbi:MAG: aldo/keto reductase [Oscillospiraceae bacterium]|nr:aldo/keto reductase [Oscillospiraceae bacterium]
MEYRMLGKTGLKISRMGFGGIPIQKIDAEGTKRVLRKLLAQGVNFIDTARAYTVSEEYLGYALEGVRDQFVLASKTYSRSKEAAAADIETSLRNLRTDYIELYQIHNPSAAELAIVQTPDGALAALQEAKAAGKIGHIGITLHSKELFEQALELDWVETIMFPYNIVETQAQELIAKCAQKNIGFIAMKPLAGGAIDNATLALRFITANPNVTVVIPGMAAEEEVDENIAACADASALTQEELEGMEKIREFLGTQFCRRCNYCAPCNVGIPIPAVFLMEGYYSRYGLQDWAKERYAALPKKASDCVQCGACESRCPYDLPIRDMMKKAKEIFGE